MSVCVVCIVGRCSGVVGVLQGVVCVCVSCVWLCRSSVVVGMLQGFVCVCACCVYCCVGVVLCCRVFLVCVCNV